MKCDPGKISAYRDGELTGGERIALERHLTECAKCRATLRAYQSIGLQIRGLPEKLPPPSLRYRVFAELSDPQVARKQRRFGKLVLEIAGLAAASVLLIVFFTMAFRGNGVNRQILARAAGSIQQPNNVPPTSNIEVQFNGEIDRPTAENAVLIEPSVDVALNWEGNKLVISPRESLQPVTQYTVTIKPGVKDRLGNSMKEPAVFGFTTAPIGEPTVLVGPIGKGTPPATPGIVFSNTVTALPSATGTAHPVVAVQLSPTRDLNPTPVPTETIRVPLWVAADLQEPATLFVGAGDSILYRAENAEGVWQPTGFGLPSENLLAPVLIADPQVPHALYLASRQGVYRSADAGLTWYSILKPLATPGRDNEENARQTSLVMDPRNHLLLYALPGDGLLYRTDDGGLNWQKLPTVPPGRRTVLLGIHPQKGTVYAGSDEGLFGSSDRGETWTMVGQEWGPVLTLVFDRVTPSTLYLGTQDKGLWKSGDGGANWSNAGRGLPNAPVRQLRAAGARILALTGREAGGAGEGKGFYLSDDGAASWRAAEGEIGGRTILGFAITRDEAVVFAATDGPLYRSDNGGLTWRKVTLRWLPAPEPAPSVEVLGVITAIRAGGKAFDLRSEDGSIWAITLAPNNGTTTIASGGQPAKSVDLRRGDRVQIVGQTEAGPLSMAARLVHLLPPLPPTPLPTTPLPTHTIQITPTITPTFTATPSPVATNTAIPVAPTASPKPSATVPPAATRPAGIGSPPTVAP